MILVVHCNIKLEMLEESRFAAEWSYAPSDVEIMSTVVGRGAFGEVRLAKWRGTMIAAKVLHALLDSNIEVDIIKEEVELLSS